MKFVIHGCRLLASIGITVFTHMNTSIVLSLLLALLLFSCSQEQENNDFFDLTSMPAVSVEGELIDEYLMAYKSNQMKFIQSKLFHFEPTEQEVCLVTTEENVVKTETGRYEYKVLIEDGVEMKEFYERYNVIEQDGEIWIIEDKESVE